jgi:hypothetical protein
VTIAAAAYALVVGCVVASPALAVEEGAQHGPGLGTGVTLLIFAGIPLGVLAVVAGLVYLPSLMRRSRYRPGRTEWDYAPMWIGGPPDPQTALTRQAPDRVGDVRGGGAGASW